MGRWRRLLANLYFESSGFRVTGGVGDGQCVNCCFCWSYTDTMRVRGPDGIGLRLECDGFGVGHAVAKLDGLATANLSRRGVEVLDGEVLPAESFEDGAVLLLLLLRSLFFRAIIDDAIFVPTGEEDPSHDENRDDEDARRVKETVFKDGFGWRIRLSKQLRTPRKQIPCKEIA